MRNTLLVLLAMAGVAFGANVTWTSATEQAWATGAAWSTGAQPAAGDTVIFDGTGNGNCYMLANSNGIARLYITSGYTGRFNPNGGTVLIFARNTCTPLQIDTSVNLNGHSSGTNGFKIYSMTGSGITITIPEIKRKGGIIYLSLIGDDATNATFSMSGNISVTQLDILNTYAGRNISFFANGYRIKTVSDVTTNCVLGGIVRAYFGSSIDTCSAFKNATSSAGVDTAFLNTSRWSATSFGNINTNGFIKGDSATINLASYRATIMAQNASLVSYYTSRVNGDTLYDSTGTYKAIKSGNPTQLTGRIGPYIQYASASSQYASCGRHSELESIQKMTWSGIFRIRKPSSTYQAVTGTLASKGSASNTYVFVNVNQNTALGGGALDDCNRSIYVALKGDQDGTFTFNAPNLSYESWNHIAVVFDLTNIVDTASMIKAYLNGSRLTLTKRTGTASWVFPSSTTGMFLSYWSALGNYFNGDIDQWATWARALQPWEIVAQVSSFPIVHISSVGTDRKIYNRDPGKSYKTLTLSGSFGNLVAPKTVQARVLDWYADTVISNWVTIDSNKTITSTSYSGQYQVPIKKTDYRFQTRILDTNAVAICTSGTTTNRISVGYNFLVIGQSNAVGIVTGSYTAAAFGVRQWPYHSQVWDSLTDPWISGSGASFAPSLGNSLSSKVNAMVGFIPKPASSTAMTFDVNGTRWCKVGDTTTLSGLALANQKRAANDTIEGVICYQGETDAANSVSSQTYQDSANAMISRYRAYFGYSPKFYFVQIGRYLAAAAKDTGYSYIRRAQANLDNPTNGVYLGACAYAAAVSTADSIHLTKIGQDSVGKWLSNTIAYSILGTGNYRGPMITKMSKITGGAELTVTFAGDTLLPATGKTGFQVKKVSDASWATPDSVIRNGTKLNVFYAAPISHVRYAFGAKPVVTGFVYDNSVNRLPMEPLYEITAQQSGGGRQSAYRNDAYKNYGYRNNPYSKAAYR
jgi:hypothetical protein